MGKLKSILEIIKDLLEIFVLIWSIKLNKKK